MKKKRALPTNMTELWTEVERRSELPFRERYDVLISILGEEKVRRWEQAYLSDDEDDEFDLAELFDDAE